ncbi:3-oxoacyl-[acyl-carrier protein] reductase [Capronia epimyces CBS 606.96]|uniref:3-oxoacyl-[acyl-carrier protein] reductase n=1 Tax=Capronia epimyces CBS 606.96 TaxID=1182542 RepID=W9YJ24_9EURO|nr:3-oxoacyl-[acyl-carrier protein] reductase [Capronia epimyces CBS 606.96]EXJ89256.1 3-oxoacyl-[acyl-carrier protein] reductase [Capronia epimyces CBS 606.96]
MSSLAPNGQLASKRIIVTGGAQGIGESVVRAFAAEGAIVTSMDLNDSLGARVAAEASKTGPGKVSYLPVDISSKESVTEAFNQAAEDMGGLDAMFNVAGYQRHAAPDDPPQDILERITKVNIWGTIYTNATAFAIMKQGGKGGAIVNFGSEAGLTAEHHNSLYGMSKGAVHTWTRSVAREWGPFNVRVNAVLPYVATPMYDAFRDALSPDELERHKLLLKEQFPLGGNLGDPTKDLAPVLVFLASDASHWMTGQLFPVDGGYVAVR